MFLVHRVFSPGRARFGWALLGRALISDILSTGKRDEGSKTQTKVWALSFTLIILLLSSGCLAPISFHVHLDKHYHGEESSKSTSSEDLIRSVFDVEKTEKK